MQDSIAQATTIETHHPQTEMRRNWLPVAALLAAALFWGCSFSGMRFVLQTINPWSTMWLRMVIALTAILPLAGRLRQWNYCRGDWKLLLPMVLLQPCLYFLLESNALRLTTSSQAGVISASVPLLVTVGACLLLGEAFNRRAMAGITLSATGVVGLTLLQGGQGSGVNPVAGNLLEVLAMICAAANMLLVKKLSSRYSAWVLTALQVMAGTVFFLPGLWMLINGQAALLTPALMIILVFLGLFVSLGAFGLYNWGMSQIPAGQAANFINLVPMFAVLLGWLVMNESLTPGQWLAASAVIGGVWVSQGRARRGASPT